MTVEHFATSVNNAVKYVYKAVAEPVEGTILTLVRTWSDFIYANRHRIGDFGQLFVDSRATLRQSLAETPTKLEVLARNNKVMARIRRECRNRMIWKYIVLYANTPSAADWYAKHMTALTGQHPVADVNISPVVGANAGVGAVSVAFMFD